MGTHSVLAVLSQDRCLTCAANRKRTRPLKSPMKSSTHSSLDPRILSLNAVKLPHDMWERMSIQQRFTTPTLIPLFMPPVIVILTHAGSGHLTKLNVKFPEYF